MSRRRFPAGLGLVLGLTALLAARPVPAAAQDDARLQEALRLAQDGQSDSARAVVSRLAQATAPTDSLYPEVLYTMGLVSRSVEEMRRSYSRVAVEFANSAWADNALFRLGLLDYAAGNLAGAVHQMERVRADYPDSPLIPAAAEWAGRALFEQRKPADACVWLALGLERVDGDIELANRLRFLEGRCAALPVGDSAGPGAPVPGADSSRPAPAPVPAPQPAPARAGFGVQVGAVNSQAAADKLITDVKAAGFTPYLVRDGGLMKVRVGPFPDRPAAVAVVARVKAKLGGQPFVVKEP